MKSLKSIEECESKRLLNEAHSRNKVIDFTIVDAVELIKYKIGILNEGAFDALIVDIKEALHDDDDIIGVYNVGIGYNGDCHPIYLYASSGEYYYFTHPDQSGKRYKCKIATYIK